MNRKKNRYTSKTAARPRPIQVKISITSSSHARENRRGPRPDRKVSAVSRGRAKT
ncbi:hypothetical protein Acaty_c0313 [Acidithiobacillus caldus ATCC 51756]|uniref:Uncharacterized protein n=1 Tax=Acidithiobacillus caldus (strain ATCC 51756 / DSM 8584 / KU) TaxID=637389 RepID=A0A059ZRQ0_ACICK|nr:hypothetical protein Acaty_c0313 [Acidithiobacillus caldus ATCC 51756]